MGHNELLIRDALRDRDRDTVLLSVKFGSMRDPAGRPLANDARPEATKSFLAYSLKRLGTDHLDVYRPARLDPQVPIEETRSSRPAASSGSGSRPTGSSRAG